MIIIKLVKIVRKREKHEQQLRLIYKSYLIYIGTNYKTKKKTNFLIIEYNFHLNIMAERKR